MLKHGGEAAKFVASPDGAADPPLRAGLGNLAGRATLCGAVDFVGSTESRPTDFLNLSVEC